MKEFIIDNWQILAVLLLLLVNINIIVNAIRISVFNKSFESKLNNLLTIGDNILERESNLREIKKSIEVDANLTRDFYSTYRDLNKEALDKINKEDRDTVINTLREENKNLKDILTCRLSQPFGRINPWTNGSTFL